MNILILLLVLLIFSTNIFSQENSKQYNIIVKNYKTDSLFTPKFNLFKWNEINSLYINFPVNKDLFFEETNTYAVELVFTF